MNEKFVPPAVESLKAFGIVHVVDQDAAVGAAVECDAERLKSLLTGRIPKLVGMSATEHRLLLHLLSQPPVKLFVPAW